MQRSDLTGTVLSLKMLGVDNLQKFEWLAPPPAEAMVRALELLHALGALDDDARSSAGLTWHLLVLLLLLLPSSALV
jgi:ATP-dependent RNA helicase DDX35